MAGYFYEASPESSPQRDAGIREPPPLTWGEWDSANHPKWSRTEEDLECLPPLDPHLETFLARAEGGGNPKLTLSPEPSFNNRSEWVRWHAKQLETLTWWWKLSNVPGQMDVQEFVRQVWASFWLPEVNCHAQGVANDYSVLPAPQSLDLDWLLPLSNMRFGGQDYHMKQYQKTLAYAKALQ